MFRGVQIVQNCQSRNTSHSPPLTPREGGGLFDRKRVRVYHVREEHGWSTWVVPLPCCDVVSQSLEFSHERCLADTSIPPPPSVGALNDTQEL